MAISSNTLFHYTHKFNILQDIIEKGFLVSYCMESIMAIPMVSFCDIPLSQAKYYLENYGSYAMGMTTEWGVKNGLNPVLYLEEDSHLYKALNQAMESIKGLQYEFGKDDKKDVHQGNINKYIIETTRYAKPYKGTLIRDGIEKPNYKFYDEREWRFIPTPENNYFKLGLTPEGYLEFKKSHPKKPHFNENGLTFNAKDIKYIILKKSAEIPMLIDYLMGTTHLGSAKEIQLLTTKILLAEQIIEDV